MHYHVTGTNHATGARMSLEVDAANKIDAERKARAAGMDVQHAQVVQPDGSTAEHHGSRRRGEDPGPQTGMHPMLKTAIWLIALAGAGYAVWRYVVA